MTQPLKVLHVVRPAAGGIRRHVLNLLDGLDPALITNSAAAPPPFLASLGDCANLHASVPLEIAARLSPSDWRAAARLARVRPQFGDIIHAHGLRGAWIAVLAHARRPFPLVFTAHNEIERSLFARAGVAFISRRCAKIIAVSEAVAGSLAACGAPRSGIVVIPNGVDAGAFTAHPNARTEARIKFGLSQSAFVVAAAGRLSPEKGFDVLIDAARQRRTMTFLLAGDGPLSAELARDLPPNVTLLGHLDDIRPLLSAADVFAVPSRREGQGIAALEAMAAGTPLAASRVGGLAEMLSDGSTALLVPPGNPAALAAALSRLQSDTRLSCHLAESAASLVREQYSLRTMLERITELYREIGMSV